MHTEDGIILRSTCRIVCIYVYQNDIDVVVVVVLFRLLMFVVFFPALLFYFGVTQIIFKFMLVYCHCFCFILNKCISVHDGTLLCFV